MWNIIVTAFSLGFLGSVHCAGMCGSLMIYNFSQLKNYEFGIKFFIYHLFRIMAYVLLGVMFGQLGFIGQLLGLQKIVSLLSGIILIYIAFTYFFPISIKVLNDWNVYAFINELFNISSSSYYRYAIAGFANGLLPCGLSFIAIVFSVTTYSMVYGAAFMLAFGLGNIPALLAVSVLSQKLQFNKNWFKFTMPALSLIIGVLLILRSMNLGIPYISPEYHFQNNKPILECHK